MSTRIEAILKERAVNDARAMATKALAEARATRIHQDASSDHGSYVAGMLQANLADAYARIKDLEKAAADDPSSNADIIRQAINEVLCVTVDREGFTKLECDHVTIEPGPQDWVPLEITGTASGHDRGWEWELDWIATLVEREKSGRRGTAVVYLVREG